MQLAYVTLNTRYIKSYKDNMIIYLVFLQSILEIGMRVAAKLNNYKGLLRLHRYTQAILYQHYFCCLRRNQYWLIISEELISFIFH